MSREAEVLDQMRSIMDPDLGKDIVSLGFIKNLQITAAGVVSFAVELTTPACPVKEQFRTQCEQNVRRLPWVTEVKVTMSAAKGGGGGTLRTAGPGLAGVKHLIAVSSCKGGVGKSTVAVNLAFALAAAGAKVGIFDADVYGPSLPTMVRVDNFDGLYQKNQLIIPVEAHGLKLMSFAYANPHANSAAILRGPMVTGIINQLLTGTSWGELDYLVIDMPPGTGDIQLTLTQIIPLTAAVIVTTPQHISFIDVVKGIEMFDKLKVPTVAVVENMSYFVCDQCSKKHYLFGHGAMTRLVEQYGFRHAIAVPIAPEVSRLSDAGTPVVMAAPESAAAGKYRELAAAVATEVSRLEHGGIKRPTVTHEAGVGVKAVWPDGQQRTIAPVVLRGKCECAHCVNEFTGERMLKPEDVPADVAPREIRPMGNYAVIIEWSDGHSSIYAYDVLAAFPA